MAAQSTSYTPPPAPLPEMDATVAPAPSYRPSAPVLSPVIPATPPVIPARGAGDAAYPVIPARGVVDKPGSPARTERSEYALGKGAARNLYPAEIPPMTYPPAQPTPEPGQPPRRVSAVRRPEPAAPPVIPARGVVDDAPGSPQGPERSEYPEGWAALNLPTNAAAFPPVFETTSPVIPARGVVDDEPGSLTRTARSEYALGQRVARNLNPNAAAFPPVFEAVVPDSGYASAPPAQPGYAYEYHQPAFAEPAFGEPAFGEAPEPKKHGPWLGIIVTLALFAIVAVVGYNVFGGVRDWMGRTVEVATAADYPGPGDEPVLVTIPAGATGTQMGELLYEAGVVASPEAFRNAFTANPRAGSIQPGTYELQLHMSAAQAVATMLENGTISYRLVIPEGFTAAQVFGRITSVTGISQEEIDAALADPAALGLPEVAHGNIEGWLFPATYQINPGEDAASILRTLIARTRQELTNQGADPDTWETVLNMASLVEREVRFPDDRPKVARAILNRLDRGMPLQIDAAVAYGLGISGTQLTLAHLADPANPYNTYQHAGLPPGPIANPGAAAIRAVLNPADGNWIFWVTINLATGETIFTDTYADHQRYVAVLREWQAANPGFGQPAPGEHQTD